MMWRAAIATLAALLVTPAAAQWFQQWEQEGRRPFWEQQPRGQALGNPPGQDELAREPIVRSGGGRPVIAPVAPEKVAFHSNFTPNTIVIDSGDRKLYFVLSPTEAYRYPISVGREGFTWTGTEVISRKQEWPDWYPPKEMIARDSRLPEKMTGGIRNPLGVLALYLGNTLYRIHGTNDEASIGEAASSGCFRMMNEHVVHLASIADIGTPVTVVSHLPSSLTMSTRPDSQPDAQGRLQ
ncbi:MAG TPA: L,D-transpeptidase [Hyphomicrobium sp.]